MYSLPYKMMVIIFLSILILLISILKLYKKYKIYKRYSSLKGFHPSSSLLFGDLPIIFNAYLNGAQGFEIARPLLDVSKEDKYQKCGYMALWVGNFILGYPLIVCTGSEVSKLILSSNRVLEKAYSYRFLHFVLGTNSLLYE